MNSRQGTNSARDDLNKAADTLATFAVSIPWFGRHTSADVAGLLAGHGVGRRPSDHRVGVVRRCGVGTRSADLTPDRISILSRRSPGLGRGPTAARPLALYECRAALDARLDNGDTSGPTVIPPEFPPDLPKEWAADQSDNPEVLTNFAHEADFQRAQPVLCMSVPQSVDTTPIDSCPYGVVTAIFEVKVVSATYTFTLLEARTGRLVTSVQMPGSLGACPWKFGGNADNYKIAAAPDETELETKLRPYVEGNVPAR